MTGVQTCALPICFPVTIGPVLRICSPLLVCVLDNISAVNGLPGVAYVDKMERSTSCGMPWQCSKKKFIQPLPPTPEMPNGVTFDQEIWERVDDIISKYEEGTRYCPVFCANLKDEATKFSKIAEHKTRVFAGAPVDWCIVVRKYLLTVIRLIQRNRPVFECGPGINTHSPAWHELYHYLTVFGPDRIVAGDFGNYDKSMFASIILEAFWILHEICRKAGYSDTELRVVQGIAYDTSFPFYYFFGDLIEFFGTNPSGHPLTVS